VVGYDPSEFFIQRAQDEARKTLDPGKGNIQFYSGKVDKVGKVLIDHEETKFDAIIVMFNSLGYGTTQADSSILNSLSGIAADDGVLIVEIENRDWRTKNFQPFVNYEYDEYEVHENWNFEMETSVARSISKFYLKDRANCTLKLLLTLRTNMRLYSLHEFIALLKNSGWVYQESFGSIKTLQPVSLESPDIVTISRKQKKAS
jgi:hypothetical protein